MEFNQFSQLVNRKKQTIVSIMLISLVLVLVASILSPIKYGAQSRILVMQEGVTSDAYTLSRTNEYLGNLFSQIIYSSSFFDLVMDNDNYQIDNNYFSGQQTERIKKWRNSINTRTYSDSGIIEINVYHQQPQQAQQIALSINSTLTSYSHKYSGNENIKINVIDQPLVSERPVKPNIPYIIAITILGSFILALIFIYIFPEEKYDIRLFTAKAKKSKKNIDQIIEEEEEESEEAKRLNEYYRNLEKNREDDVSGDMDNIIK